MERRGQRRKSDVGGIRATQKRQFGACHRELLGSARLGRMTNKATTSLQCQWGLMASVIMSKFNSNLSICGFHLRSFLARTRTMTNCSARPPLYRAIKLISFYMLCVRYFFLSLPINLVPPHFKLTFFAACCSHLPIRFPISNIFWDDRRPTEWMKDSKKNFANFKMIQKAFYLEEDSSSITKQSKKRERETHLKNQIKFQSRWLKCVWLVKRKRRKFLHVRCFELRVPNHQKRKRFREKISSEKR